MTNLLYLGRTAQSLEEARPYLAKAALELRRAAAIANQTVRFHRQATPPTRVTFAEVVSEIILGQRSRLNNAAIQVKKRDQAEGTVLCCEGEIRQVLTNLVSNAIDAMQGSGDTLYVRGRDGKNWKTGKTGLVFGVYHC